MQTTALFPTTMLDPFGILAASSTVIQAWSREPWQLQQRLFSFYGKCFEIQQEVLQRTLGSLVGDPVPVAAYDERFHDRAWTENPWYDLVKEYYLLVTRTVEDAIFATPGVDDRTIRRAAFWVRQMLNAVAPSNFLWTNPVALSRFISTGGWNLIHGYQQWLKDLPTGDVSIVDPDGFQVGRDIAATPGQVVYRNHLVEVIQYAPTTDKVQATPIVFIAPWINKYYVLDLTPDKSPIRYLIDQGFSVFVTSWKNPDGAMRNTSLDDYLTAGALTTIEVARQICGVESVHAVGYCIGGTLLSTLLAWAAADPATPAPVAHWTVFTTLVDFANPGDIDVFLTEEGVEWIDRMMDGPGYLDGRAMGAAFRWLRSNSLIWRYFVQNYLYGDEPAPMDVLQWNMDTTRLPKAMHSFYLREFYLKNRLVEPNRVQLAGRPIDLRRITAPLYAVGAEQDHIAPWKETFKLVSQVSGPVRYTLATSGHILGILNPPVNPPRRRYWTGEAGGATDPEAWRRGVDKVAGSWWDDWTKWLQECCGPQVAARVPGSGQYPALAPAPGTYVFEK